MHACWYCSSSRVLELNLILLSHFYFSSSQLELNENESQNLVLELN